MINGRKSAKTGRRRPPRNTGWGVLEVSDRLHLTSREVECPWSLRSTVLLLIFRHGLRVSDACRMKLDQVDTESRVLHVARLKGGLSTTRLRLRPGRSRRGYPTHSGLSRTPQHPAYRQVNGHQLSTVRKAVAVNPKDDRRRILWQRLGLRFCVLARSPNKVFSLQVVPSVCFAVREPRFHETLLFCLELSNQS